MVIFIENISSCHLHHLLINYNPNKILLRTNKSNPLQNTEIPMISAVPLKWQYNIGVGSLRIPNTLFYSSRRETVLHLSSTEMGCSDLLSGSRSGIRIPYEL